MSTGVDSLDSQHKQLISWLNDLLDAMSKGRGRDEIKGLLDKLGAYAALHFGNEEECMTKYNCPVAAKNVEMHAYFIDTFGSFAKEYDETGPTAHLTVRLQGELMRWLVGHIKRTDTQLAECIHPKTN